MNSQNTKNIIFSKRKSRLNYEFRLFGETLKVVDDFSYLDLTINNNGNLFLARKLDAASTQIIKINIFSKRKSRLN